MPSSARRAPASCPARCAPCPPPAPRASQAWIATTCPTSCGSYKRHRRTAKRSCPRSTTRVSSMARPSRCRDRRTAGLWYLVRPCVTSHHPASRTSRRRGDPALWHAARLPEPRILWSVTGTLARAGSPPPPPRSLPVLSRWWRICHLLSRAHALGQRLGKPRKGFAPPRPPLPACYAERSVACNPGARGVAQRCSTEGVTKQSDYLRAHSVLAHMHYLRKRCVTAPRWLGGAEASAEATPGG